jgi:hypothetical protein
MYKTPVDKNVVGLVLGVKPRTVDQMRVKGLIPFIKLPSGSIRYDLDAILKIIKERNADN